VDRITTARNVDAARNSDRAKTIAKAEDFVKSKDNTSEVDCEKARTSRKCKLEFNYKVFTCARTSN